MKRLFLVFSFIFLLSSCDNSSTNSNLRLYVFDCGSIKFQDISNFGLSNNATQVRELFVPCYLIEHKKGRLLWDAGLPLDIVGKGVITVRPGIEQLYKVSLLEQLQSLAVHPDEIDFIAMSHMHSDHVGAAERFIQSTLLIQEEEFEAAFRNVSNFPVFDISNYQELENNKRVTLTGNFDVFGDGSVIIISAPGHTPGHQVLLLRLKNYGPILLSGDLYHFVKSRELQAIPAFNTDAEKTLESMKKIEKIVPNESFRIIK